MFCRPWAHASSFRNIVNPPKSENGLYSHCTLSNRLKSESLNNPSRCNLFSNQYCGYAQYASKYSSRNQLLRLNIEDTMKDCTDLVCQKYCRDNHCWSVWKETEHSMQENAFQNGIWRQRYSFCWKINLRFSTSTGVLYTLTTPSHISDLVVAGGQLDNLLAKCWNT